MKTYTHCIKDLDSGKLPQWENKKVRSHRNRHHSLRQFLTKEFLSICDSSGPDGACVWGRAGASTILVVCPSSDCTAQLPMS